MYFLHIFSVPCAARGKVRDRLIIILQGQGKVREFNYLSGEISDLHKVYEKSEILFLEIILDL